MITFVRQHFTKWSDELEGGGHYWSVSWGMFPYASSYTYCWIGLACLVSRSNIRVHLHYFSAVLLASIDIHRAVLTSLTCIKLLICLILVSLCSLLSALPASQCSDLITITSAASFNFLPFATILLLLCVSRAWKHAIASLIRDCCVACCMVILRF